MARYGFALSLAVAVFATLLIGSGAQAQMPPSTSTTSTPVPGAGHDYLGEIAETVNPANGSVSIRINAIMPPGRGLTLPFSFAYDSTGVNYVGHPSTSIALAWLLPSTTFTSQGGWSNSAPMVSVNEITWTATTSEGHQEPCFGFVNYVYQDANGNRHNLNLTTYNQALANPAGACAYDESDWPFGFGALFVPQGGEVGANLGGILASIPSTDQASPGPVTVTHPDGTVLSFPNVLEDTNGTMATSVEDRNGNVITINTPSTTGAPFSYIDTAGRTALQDSGFATNPETVTIPGLNAAYGLQWTPLSTATFVGPVTALSGTCPSSFSHQSWSPTQNGLTKLTLPNTKSFSFTYDPTYSLINKMSYPTGGYIRYVWGFSHQAEFGQYAANPQGVQCAALYDVPAISDRYVSFDGVTEVLHQHFAYVTNWNSNEAVGWVSKQTTVTTTDNVRNTSYTTVYTYSKIGADEPPNAGTGLPSVEPVESSIAYYDTNGALLKTVYKTWLNTRLLQSQETQYPNGAASETTWNYNGREQQIEEDDYDFGSSGVGSKLRKIVTNYQQFNNSPLYADAPAIVDRPCQIITYDGSGNRYAERDTYYDNGSTGSPCAAAGTPAVTGVSGLTGHDETDYSASSTSARGNATTVVKQCFQGTTACASGNPTTTYTYDETGQVLSMKDPNTNTTSYSYADNFVSTNSSGFTTTAGDPPSGKVTNAYLTKITMPTTSGVAHVEKFAYGYNDGELTESFDQNTPPNVTTYKYNDSLGRLKETDYPDTGKTTLLYNDAAPSPSVNETRLIVASTNLTTNTVMDGIRHVVQDQVTSDPNCTTGDITATTYDGMGRVYTTSNPYCTTSDPTYGLTTYTYDALGRNTTLTHPDGTSISTTYTGRATLVADEGNGNGTERIQRVSQVDGLGRMVSVCEVTGDTLVGITPTPASCGLDIGAAGFLTSYAYDPLSDLTGVTQGGLNPRTFQYDSLSRLTSAQNPESGTTKYSYDSNGNLSQRVAPTATTAYTYDALNRLTSKTYSDGTLPVAYYYDQSNPWGLAQYEHNYIGRLTEAQVQEPTVALTGSVFSYDAMGRVVGEWQCTPLNCGTTSAYFSYTYDLLGDLTTSYTNFDGITYTNSYDAAARLTTMQSSLDDAQHPGTLVSFTNYNALQKPQNVTLGNGIVESLYYDNRERLWATNQGTINVYDFNICNGSCSNTGFAPNGNILYANDSANGNWVYIYDNLNRLSGGTCSGNCPAATGLGYAYDRFGNRYSETVTGGSGVQPVYSFNAKNQIDVSSVTYNAAGNVTYDGVGLGNTYTYDAENRITAVSGNGPATYVYDAFGHRVRAVVSGVNHDFLYDLSGRTIDQLTNGTLTRTEAYAGSLHVATYVNSTTEFDNSDWLGTVRVRSNVAGNKIESCTSLPFGEDLTCTGTEDSPLHFTGKEHDWESGDDFFGARYYGETIGRFVTPDPSNLSVDFFLPQTWNRYSYALNSPLTVVDRNGLWPSYFHDEIIDEAFPGLSKSQLDSLKTASAQVDEDQSDWGAYKHGMSDGNWVSGPTNDPQMAGDFIQENEHSAAQIQAEWIASGHTGIAPNAMTAFGNALHTVTDKTSPAHEGYQPWYGPWYRHPLASVYHGLREDVYMSAARRTAAVTAARQAFMNTFGWLALQNAISEPKVTVTTTNCVTDSGGKKTCNTF